MFDACNAGICKSMLCEIVMHGMHSTPNVRDRLNARHAIRKQAYTMCMVMMKGADEGKQYARDVYKCE